MMIWRLILTMLAGAAGWSFMEYALHYWGGHLARGRTFFSREHLAHHANPRYFTPTGLKLLSAAPFLVVLAVIDVKAAGWMSGLAFTGGFAGAWAAYEIAHRRVHTHPPGSSWGRWRRLNHLHHHFRDPRRNHGVTSPLWDFVFRTHVSVDEPIRVPRRMAMPWLLRAGSTEVDAAFAADYFLAGRGEGAPASSSAADALPADLSAAYAGHAPDL